MAGWPLPNPHGSPRWRPWRRSEAAGRGVPAGRRLRSSQIDTSNQSQDTRRPPPLPSPAAISAPSSISVSCCSSSCSWTAWTHGARWFSSASRTPALAGPCPLPPPARMRTAPGRQAQQRARTRGAARGEGRGRRWRPEAGAAREAGSRGPRRRVVIGRPWATSAAGKWHDVRCLRAEHAGCRLTICSGGSPRGRRG